MPRRTQMPLFRDYALQLTADETRTISDAVKILDQKLRKPGACLSSPTLVADYLKLHIGTKPYEVFVCMFLDATNRLIEAKEMFRGTLSQTSVYPREIVKEALDLNAAGLIFAHNHPSGIAEPSRADELLTQTLKQALSLVDIRVLDHFVIGKTTHISFAERGLLEPYRHYGDEPSHKAKAPHLSA